MADQSQLNNRDIGFLWQPVFRLPDFFVKNGTFVEEHRWIMMLDEMQRNGNTV